MPTNNIVPFTQVDDGSKVLKKYLRLFELSWKEARSFMDRANEDVAQYEQEINLANWPTLSEITLAEAKKFVDQGVPPIMARMFGADLPLEMIPADKDISYDTARKIRDWVIYNMRVNLGIETTGYLTIKDAVKLGKGYGIVDPKIITPPSSNQQVVLTGGEEVQNRVMGVGEPQLVPGYTYLPFGTVIPTPDGATPDEVTCTFVLRFYQEEPFRKMFDKRLNPDTPFEGDINKIIDTARSKIFNGYLNTPRQIAANIASKERVVTDALNEAGSDTPVMIPVLQCYARDEHVWFACDRYKIYHVKSKYQTLRSPVVTATFDPDGNSWFTPGIIRPRRRMIMGVETFTNAVMDMISGVLHPHAVVNQDALVDPNSKVSLSPWGETKITGGFKTGDVISWAQLPPLPPYIFQVGNKLEEFDTASIGQPRSLQGQGTPGLVRGGSGAMESLMQSSSGREKLTAQHFENGWYGSVVENTLILCQMLAKDKEFLPEINYTPESKKKFNYSEITRDDIRRVYRVQLSFSEKMRNEMAEASIRSMKYDRLIQNENYNREELAAWLLGDDKLTKRLTAGASKEANIQMMQALTQRGGAGVGGGAGVPPEQTIPGGAGTALGGLGV